MFISVAIACAFVKRLCLLCQGKNGGIPSITQRHINKKTKSEYVACFDLNVVLGTEPVVKFSPENKKSAPCLAGRILKIK